MKTELFKWAGCKTKEDFEKLYWYMREQGKKRFGQSCKHEQISRGYCINCLRKVYNKK